MINRLQCGISEYGGVRNAAGTSFFANGWTSALSGSWGSLPGPSPTNMTLDVGAGNTLVVNFATPTDRGGMPIGWPIPHASLERGISWRSTLTPDADIGIYSVGQGRWESTTRLVIEVVEPHPNASIARAQICSGHFQAYVYPNFGVRNEARTSVPASGQLTLGGGGCIPGRSPSVYSAGYANHGALGLPEASLLDCSASGYRTSASPQLAAIEATNGLAVAALAAAGQFSMMMLADGTVRTWGTAIASVAGQRIETASPTSLELPTHVSPATGLTASLRAVVIAAGCEHALILLEDGSVCGFGRDDEGQLYGATAATAAAASLATTLTCHPLPSTLPPMRHVACGCHHSVLLARDSDDVYTFGEHDAGQVGHPRVPSECHPSTARVPSECRPSAIRVPSECSPSAVRVPSKARCSLSDSLLPPASPLPPNSSVGQCPLRHPPCPSNTTSRDGCPPSPAPTAPSFHSPPDATIPSPCFLRAR